MKLKLGYGRISWRLTGELNRGAGVGKNEGKEIEGLKYEGISSGELRKGYEGQKT